MKKTICAVLLGLLAGLAMAQVGSPIPSTVFTRDVLRATNAPDFMARAGLTTNLAYTNLTGLDVSETVGINAEQAATNSAMQLQINTNIETTNGVAEVSFQINGQLTIGSGSNAVVLASDDGGGLNTSDVDWLLNGITANWGVFDAITFNGVERTNWPVSIVSTPESLVFSSNSITFTATNRITLGTFASLSSYTLGSLTNAFASGSIPPLPDYGLEVSTNGGTDWFEAATAEYPVTVSIYDNNSPGAAGYLTSVELWAYGDVSTISNVIDTADQVVRVDAPVDSRDVVNLATLQSAVAVAAANWSTFPATGTVNINNMGMVLSPRFRVAESTGTNQFSLDVLAGGTSALSIFAAAGGDVTNSVITYQFTSSNAVFTVPAPGISAFGMQANTNGVATTNWYDLTATTNYLDGNTLYFVTDLPTVQPIFYRGKITTSDELPGYVSVPQLAIATSHTPSSSSEVNPVGSIFWDASYLYVQTATNVNKRVALSTW